jgi:hypothetical protein
VFRAHPTGKVVGEGREISVQRGSAMVTERFVHAAGTRARRLGRWEGYWGKVVDGKQGPGKDFLEK